MRRLAPSRFNFCCQKNLKASWLEVGIFPTLLYTLLLYYMEFRVVFNLFRIFEKLVIYLLKREILRKIKS